MPITLILQFIFNKITHDSTANRTQKTVILLVAEIVSRGPAGEGASDSPFTLGVTVLIRRTIFITAIMLFVCIRYMD